MKRLPRKRKKQVKKIVERKRAYKIAMVGLMSVQARAQISLIVSRPISYFPPPVNVANKAASVAKAVVDAATAIQRIMSEPPNSWREFIR